MTLSRRSWLRGVLAGAGAAMGGVAFNRFAYAADRPGPRFVFVVEGNCVEPAALLSPSARDAINGHLRAPVGTRRWWPGDYGDSLVQVNTADLTGAPALTGLGDFAASANVLFGLSCKVSGGGHTAYHGALTSTRTVSGSPGGASIDAFLAREVPNFADCPFDAVRVGVGERPLNTQTCAFERGLPAPILQRPTTAYQVLLGAATGDTAFAQRGRMLRFAREDVAHRLEGFRGPASERMKLETYLGSIESVEAQQSVLAGITVDASVLPPSPEEDPRYTSDVFFERLALQFEIATATLIGGLTNIAVIASGTGDEFGSVQYPGLVSSGMPVGRHDLHHQSSGDAATVDVIHRASGRHVELIAEMARRLAAVPEGDGTMLDNTLIVYLGDNGESHHASAREFPILTVGGRGLGISGGRTLFYPGLETSEHRRLANLWITLAQIAGLDTQVFGDDDFRRVPGGSLPAFL